MTVGEIFVVSGGVVCFALLVLSLALWRDTSDMKQDKKKCCDCKGCENECASR